jgi:hypothetical protein
MDGSLARYADGLARQIELLERLRALAAHQQDAAIADDTSALSLTREERARLAHALSELEATLCPIRQCLADAAPALSGQVAFEALRAAHRHAERIVADILAHDAVTRDAIERGGSARREASHAIDTAEATLAAYRRVLAPSQGPAGLVDRRG